VSELDITGGDSRKVGLYIIAAIVIRVSTSWAGYYAGLFESLFFVTQALMVLQWSRVLDHVGRKPVLLLGTLGLDVSILCFGLSHSGAWS